MRRTRLLPLGLRGGPLPPALAARAGSAGRAGGTGRGGRGGRARGLHVVGRLSPPAPSGPGGARRSWGRTMPPRPRSGGCLTLGARGLEAGGRGRAGANLPARGRQRGKPPSRRRRRVQRPTAGAGGSRSAERAAGGTGLVRTSVRRLEQRASEAGIPGRGVPGGTGGRWRAPGGARGAGTRTHAAGRAGCVYIPQPLHVAPPSSPPIGRLAGPRRAPPAGAGRPLPARGRPGLLRPRPAGAAATRSTSRRA